MKKIISSILVGTLVMSMLLSGCSNSTVQTQTSSDTSTKKSVDGIQYGQILSVSDSEIVLALGTMDSKKSTDNANENASGSAVQAPQNNKAPQGDGAQGGTPPQGNPPSGDNGGNPPSGNNPPSEGTSGSGMRAGGGFEKSMIELTGDKLTLTVSDKTTISYMKKDRDTEDTSDAAAKLSDLKEGDIIAVTLDEDGKTALEITIMSMRNHHDANVTATAVSTEE